MIVRERENAFVMLEQHHHGEVAGQLYRHLKEEFLPSMEWRKVISSAIIYHDCGWIPFDKEPLWNDEKSVPYSFIDLPIGPKIVLYQFGIDQVEEKSPYAALLCSMHYVSFLTKRHDALSVQFVAKEQVRQARIKKTFHITDDSLIKRHYELLKFFDDLSLYLCINELGTVQDNVHFFFKEGLIVPSSFHQQKLQLRWDQNNIILMNQDLFNEPFTIQIHQKVVSKKKIKKLGIKQAYLEAVTEEVPITIGFNTEMG